MCRKTVSFRHIKFEMTGGHPGRNTQQAVGHTDLELKKEVWGRDFESPSSVGDRRLQRRQDTQENVCILREKTLGEILSKLGFLNHFCFSSHSYGFSEFSS